MTSGASEQGGWPESGVPLPTAPVSPRVTFLIDSLGSGGAQRQMVELATRLHRSGWSVTVDCYHSDEFFQPALRASGVPTDVRASTSRIGRVLNSREMLRRSAPEVVVAFLTRPSQVAEVIRVWERFRFRLIVSERSLDTTVDMGVRLRLGLHRFADAIVANSYSQAAFLGRTSSRVGQRVHVIRNCVDLDAFQYKPPSRHESGLRVVTVASYVPVKNPRVLIEGFARYLETDNPTSASLQWFGNRSPVDPQGTEAVTLRSAEALVEERGLQEVVTLGDRTLNVVDAISSADVFCLASSIEGCPNVIGEAMALGVPVLATNVGDVPDIVKDGVHGFIFEPGDPEEAARALRRYAHLSSGERLEMSQRCRARAEEVFSPEAFVAAWAGTIRRVLQLRNG